MYMHESPRRQTKALNLAGMANNNSKTKTLITAKSAQKEVNNS